MGARICPAHKERDGNVGGAGYIFKLSREGHGRPLRRRGLYVLWRERDLRGGVRRCKTTSPVGFSDSDDPITLRRVEAAARADRDEVAARAAGVDVCAGRSG